MKMATEARMLRNYCAVKLSILYAGLCNRKKCKLTLQGKTGQNVIVCLDVRFTLNLCSRQYGIIRVADFSIKDVKNAALFYIVIHNTAANKHAAQVKLSSFHNDLKGLC